MKILAQITESDKLRSLTEAAGKFKASDYFNLAEFLSPQWFAGFSGLKKLIEKDYNHDEDPGSLSLTSV